ncbi:MAG TPA: hypothetical protein VFO28_17625 [Burkholderiaceae bacterium]|nr:hypothetical protein [Burkholderiaceae bacterium]
MPIVVFWMENADAPAHRAFGDLQLTDALKFTEALRAAGKRHVTISSELGDSIGKPGVDAVEGGRLPGGAAYEFDKRHRGGGPRSD